jgi:hypothetical protein
MRGARTRATPCPAARYFVLLSDAGFIREPDFYLARIDALLLGNLFQTGGKAFLKSSIALSV